jgi:cytochrome c-type biogenesis protein CcmH
MTTFVLLAVLLVAIALAVVSRPLWSQARGLALALIVALPASVGALYVLKGQPLALDAANIRPPTTVDEAVAQLERRLAATPDDADGRVLLARTYAERGQAAKAEAMFAQALALRPDDTTLAVEYAQAQVRAAPKHDFSAKSVALLERAVEADPESQRGLFLLGVHRLKSGQPAQAAALWERLLPLVEPAAAAALREEIDRARAEAKLPALPEPTVAIAGPVVTIHLDVSPALRADVKPGAIVFVFARPPGGAGPPVAAKRIAVAELPMTVTLSDADSPMPAAKLSAQTRVVVSARLSRSGAVAAGPGDIGAEPMTVAVGAKVRTTLTLSRRLP